MNAEDIMTPSPACCGPEAPLTDVARIVLESDCGCVTVIDEAGRPVGVVTDRDIASRGAMHKHDTRALRAADCMSAPVVVVARDETVDECAARLEENQIRRVIVVEDDGSCCGIVALADIARAAAESSGHGQSGQSGQSGQPGQSGQSAGRSVAQVLARPSLM